MKKLSKSNKRLLVIYISLFILMTAGVIPLDIGVGLMVGVSIGTWVGYRGHEEGEPL